MQIVHPAGPCRVLVADPPWAFGDAIQGKRGAESKYPCLSISDIQRFPLPEFEANALLLLWRVAAMPREALAVLDAWGFTPKSEITWVKTNGQIENGKPALDERGLPKLHMGMGHYTRAATEKAILATRGRFHIDDRGVRDTFFAPVGEHSEKPDEFFDLIERLTGGRGPYVELFARKPRAGWLVVGNEIPALPDDTRPANATRALWTPGVSKALAAKANSEETNLTSGEVEAMVAAVNAESARPASLAEQSSQDITSVEGWSLAKMRADSHVEPSDLKVEPAASHEQVAPAISKETSAAVPSPAPRRDPMKLSPEDQRKADYVTRAIAEGILPKTIIATERLEGAWIKLQFCAPVGFFDRPIDAPAKRLAPAPGTGIEIPIADIATALAKFDVHVKVTELATMTPDVRLSIAGWINTGAEPTKMPAPLATLLAKNAVNDAGPGVEGCAACDRGEPLAEGTEYLHTGRGSTCSTMSSETAAAGETTKGKRTRKSKKDGEQATASSPKSAVPSPQSVTIATNPWGAGHGWDRAKIAVARGVDGQDAAV